MPGMARSLATRSARDVVGGMSGMSICRSLPLRPKRSLSESLTTGSEKSRLKSLAQKGSWPTAPFRPFCSWVLMVGTTAAETLTVAEPVTSGAVRVLAVTVSDPEWVPCTSPPTSGSSTAAVDGDATQSVPGWWVRSWEWPSENVPMAVSCRVWPGSIVPAAGVTLREVSVEFVTETTTETETGGRGAGAGMVARPTPAADAERAGGAWAGDGEKNRQVRRSPDQAPRVVGQVACGPVRERAHRGEDLGGARRHHRGLSGNRQRLERDGRDRHGDRSGYLR